MGFKYKNDFLKSKGFSKSLLAILLFAPQLPQTRLSGPASIRAEELREKAAYLASNELKGRGNGSPQLRMAADYIADVFKKNGLKPAGDSGTYLQNFRMFTARLGPGNSFRVDASEYAPGSDYVPHYLSPSEDVEGPLVFVGYGISAPQLKFDELAGINLRGRIAVVRLDVELDLVHGVQTARQVFAAAHAKTRAAVLALRQEVLVDVAIGVLGVLVAQVDDALQRLRERDGRGQRPHDRCC